MELPDFLHFAPVPLKSRHDGWSPDLQRRFVLALAEGAGVGAAARSAGKNRQTAYALRKRPGAGSFAAAWDAALAFAKGVKAAKAALPAPPPARPAAAAPDAPIRRGEGDKSDKKDARLLETLNILNMRRPTVALRPATLRRPPC